MRELTKKGVHFKWTEDHEEEFREVKQVLLICRYISYQMSCHM